jgi:predicted phosphodiesterase
MTLIAGLYDIHGNLPALEAVLAEARGLGVDLIIVGGDIFPGPMANDALARLLTLDIPCRFILGNGDRAVLDEWKGREPDSVPASVRPILRWHAAQLDATTAATLTSWPGMLTLHSSDLGEILFVHATPESDTDIFTRQSPDHRLQRIFNDASADVIVCGHTHMQFDIRVGRTRVVNAGSVGMPFGAPGAYWLLLGRDDIRLRHTMYDLEHAAARIRSTSYPQAEEFTSRYVLDPPSEGEMLALYARWDAR